MNTYIRDNQNALDGGRLSVTSQAAGDVLYASSSTQLARLAADAGKYLQSGASAPTWETVTGYSTNVLAKSGDYTVTTGDAGNNGIVLVTSSGGNVTITLYAASGNANRIVQVKKLVAANSVIIDGNAAETIDSATTQTIAAQFTSISMCCDGSNWHII
jgi:hypothetical protein